MWEYIIPILLAAMAARIGRFLGASNSRGLKCNAVGKDTDYSGMYCEKIRGHFGIHRATVTTFGVYKWHYEWRTGERVKEVRF